MRFDFQFYGDDVLKVTNDELKRRAAAGAYHLQGKIIQRVSGAGSGETYPVPGTRNRTYQASAPGEAPAVLFGQLKRSIAVELNSRVGAIEVKIGVRGVPYAKRLEFGFIGVDKLGRRYNQAPRPFFKVTYEEQRAHIINILRNGV